MSGPAPLFDRPRAIGPAVLILEPQIRLGGGAGPDDKTFVTDLAGELRRAFASAGITTAEAPADSPVAQLRQDLLGVWLDGRAQGLGRLKPGADLDLGGLRQVAAAAGARTVVLPVLTRTGMFPGPDGYVPRPADEIIPAPEDRPDHVIPRTGRDEFPEGVELDLLIVDGATSRVVTHRRVSYPAAGRTGARDAVETLVHEAVRGLTRGEP